jgi:hypothetical protein
MRPGVVVAAIVVSALGILWAIALLDVLQRAEWEFPSLLPRSNNRVFWLFVVLFLNSIGAFFYYFMVMRPYPRRRC